MPCPFCGHAAIVTDQERLFDSGWIVKCPNVQYAAGPEACPVSPCTLPHTSKDVAIRAWNKRSPSPYLVSPVTSLRRS
jgi:hypothetical protein